MNLPPEIALRFASCSASEPPRVERLPVLEREIAAAFGSEKRRREFALGRMTARALLAERLGLDESAVPLRIAADGAPEVDAPLHVSIAHASTAERSIAVAAAAPHAVGADIELIRPRRPDLYRFLLHPDDFGLLDALPHEHDAAQVLLWTLKEAVLKARRSGFRTSPKAIRLAIESGSDTAEARLGDERWALRYARRDGCFVAVAFPE